MKNGTTAVVDGVQRVLVGGRWVVVNPTMMVVPVAGRPGAQVGYFRTDGGSAVGCCLLCGSLPRRVAELGARTSRRIAGDPEALRELEAKVEAALQAHLFLKHGVRAVRDDHALVAVVSE